MRSKLGSIGNFRERRSKMEEEIEKLRADQQRFHDALNRAHVMLGEYQLKIMDLETELKKYREREL